MNRYLTKEFFQNFLVSFFFFFCIFFVNSILLLVQKILLKNIDFATMLEMVLLSMPQFLVYVFPFATLAATSMIMGDLASQNELLALRSCGISSRKIYRPILVIALIMSVITFLIADILHPWSSVVYKDKLAVLMAEMPTFEIEPNSVNTVGNIILKAGRADGNQIDDLVLISRNDSDMDKTVISERGILSLIDPYNYIYSLSLDSPEILLTDPDDIDSYGLSRADRATFFLDFSDQIPSLTSNSPVNLTSRELLEAIKPRNEAQREDRRYYKERNEGYLLNIADAITEAVREESSTEEIINQNTESYEKAGRRPVNFYGQYYKAEFTKKFVLSLACFTLTLIALPLSNVRMRHGKLTGFGIALLVAVAFWYMIFIVQLYIFDISISPYLLMATPDIIITAIAAALLIYFRKAR